MRASLVVVGVALLALMAARAEEKKEKKEAPSYSKDIKPILENNCSRCHNSETRKGGVDVSSVSSLLKGGKRGKKILVPSEPEKSPLLGTMEGRGKAMPPRKERHQPTRDEIAQIRKWIAGGAKDDSKKE